LNKHPTDLITWQS